MSESQPASEPGANLLAVYDEALPQVYGYLLRRCGSPSVAEDLTSETFIAAVDAIRGDRLPSLTVAWLIGVARHKLVDHWRRLEREQRLLSAIDGEVTEDTAHWDERLDAQAAHATLATLGPAHRSVLTLRYLDGLPMSEVAGVLERSVGATEVLLMRARRAFRVVHETRHPKGDR
jgi:RNA polymerase sigma-70 factor (ECF subfamily)